MSWIGGTASPSWITAGRSGAERRGSAQRKAIMFSVFVSRRSLGGDSGKPKGLAESECGEGVCSGGPKKAVGRIKSGEGRRSPRDLPDPLHTNAGRLKRRVQWAEGRESGGAYSDSCGWGSLLGARGGEEGRLQGPDLTSERAEITLFEPLSGDRAQVFRSRGAPSG